VGCKERGALYTASCPENSVGDDVDAGCAVNEGYSGGVTATTTSPFFDEDIAAVPCPPNSAGDVPTGCAVNAGYSGGVTGTTTSPFFDEDIAVVPCPPNSAGDVPTGCAVNAGYSGGVTATTTSPFFQEDITDYSLTESRGVLAMPALVSVITVALVAFAGV
jgi:hypothetical protein